MKSSEKKPEGNGIRTNDDVHRLRGIRLKGLKRDPSYFLGDCQVEQAHLQECFDADTLFYDIFFEPTNRYLVAVGPPLGNLQVDTQIWVNGERIKLKVIRRAAKCKHLVRGRVKQVAKRNDIAVQANGQRWELDIPENNTGTGHRFTLCAKQKGNREQWIKDWIEHYRKIGVDRVILYDNNSEKLPDVDAIVIPCPYKFGLNKYHSLYGQRVNKTTFLQNSLLTICGYKYRSGHLLNFDIDELLQVKSLEKFREQQLVYFNSYLIETKTDGKLPEDYSFRHFIYRNAHPRNRSYKYIVRMDALLYSRDPHWAKLNPIPRNIRRIVSGLMRIWLHLKEKLPVVSKIAPQNERSGEAQRFYKHEPLSTDVYHHYKGINTGWRDDRSTFDETTEVVKLED